MNTEVTDTTRTRATCAYCGQTILRRASDDVWFSRGSVGEPPLTGECKKSPGNAHDPAVNEQDGTEATLNMTRGMLNASRRMVEELKAERDKLERDIRDLVYERAELLKNRDAAESLASRFDPGCGVGRTRTFIADLRNALRGRS